MHGQHEKSIQTVIRFLFGKGVISVYVFSSAISLKRKLPQINKSCDVHGVITKFIINERKKDRIQFSAFQHTK